VPPAFGGPHAEGSTRRGSDLPPPGIAAQGDAMPQTPREVILGPMRLPFLLLTPVCLLVGVAAAWWEGAPLTAWKLVLLLIGGTAAHVAVNALNEYQDYRSGLDQTTRPTPFSGGSQALPRHPGREKVALTTGLTALAVTAASGLVFVADVGLDLLPLGLLGLIAAVAYTPWLTRTPWLCLVAPGLGFGLLMVMGAGYVMSGRYTVTLLTAALVPFFLVNDLLLLNQLPDIEPDRAVGRRHLAIVHGRDKAVAVYTIQLLLAYLTVVIGWGAGLLPDGCLIALATVVLALVVIRKARTYGGSVPELIPALGLNVAINLLTPLLLGIGFFVSGRSAG
jgi:1,4-dihydroxy-2-naphthoate octaprenyltransferase